MANESIAKDLVRVKRALTEREPLWMPTLVVLSAALTKAWKQVQNTPTYVEPYERKAHYEKERALIAAFLTTVVAGISAKYFSGALYSGMSRSLQYFEAIFSQLADRGQSRYRFLWSTFDEAVNFEEVRARVPKHSVTIATNIDNLIRAVESEPKAIDNAHASNALATMLYAPILYPPKNFPDIDGFALFIEWQIWRKYLPMLSVEIAHDKLREKIYEPRLVRLDTLFARLKHIITTSAAGIVIPSEMKNLDEFRRKYQAGLIDSATLNDVPPLTLDLVLDQPAAVVAWRKATGGESAEMVRTASQRIKWSDAGL